MHIMELDEGFINNSVIIIIIFIITRVSYVCALLTLLIICDASN
jgi:hypothetical protein